MKKQKKKMVIKVDVDKQPRKKLPRPGQVIPDKRKQAKKKWCRDK